MQNFNSDIFCERVNTLFGKTGQKELSKKLGISQSLISDMMNGNVKSPRADTLFSIANHFGVSVDWLLGLSDVKSTDKATKEQIYNEGFNAGYMFVASKLKTLCDEL